MKLTMKALTAAAVLPLLVGASFARADEWDRDNGRGNHGRGNQAAVRDVRNLVRLTERLEDLALQEARDGDWDRGDRPGRPGRGDRDRDRGQYTRALEDIRILLDSTYRLQEEIGDGRYNEDRVRRALNEVRWNVNRSGSSIVGARFSQRVVRAHDRVRHAGRIVEDDVRYGDGGWGDDDGGWDNGGGGHDDGDWGDDDGGWDQDCEGGWDHCDDGDGGIVIR